MAYRRLFDYLNDRYDSGLKRIVEYRLRLDDSVDLIDENDKVVKSITGKQLRKSWNDWEDLSSRETQYASNKSACKVRV